MTITKEEFKELVALSNEAWEKFKELSPQFQEIFLEELLFPAFDWIEKKLNISELNLLTDLSIEKQYPIDWETNEEGYCCNIEYTDDLDKIYDKYIASSLPQL